MMYNSPWFTKVTNNDMYRYKRIPHFQWWHLLDSETSFQTSNKALGNSSHRVVFLAYSVINDDHIVVVIRYITDLHFLYFPFILKLFIYVALAIFPVADTSGITHFRYYTLYDQHYHRHYQHFINSFCCYIWVITTFCIWCYKLVSLFVRSFFAPSYLVFELIAFTKMFKLAHYIFNFET